MKNTKIFLLLFGFLPLQTMAHDVVTDLENMSNSQAASVYLFTGYKHILPLGLDHILFIVSLVLLSSNIRQLIWLSTVFTIGHCITLGLAMFGIFGISPNIVEPLIAVSIIYVAIENIFSKKIKTSSFILVFAFGLLHGMGFAGALTEIGLPQNAYLTSLFMFNIGVELGQITVIFITFLLIKKIKNTPIFNWSKITVYCSSAIIVISTYWFFERV
jgi:hydrogenase/urease accessory protein HupE